MNDFFNFLFSSDSQSLVTIIAGTFAFFIWKLQLRSDKSEVAKIIVSEIISAENTIEEISKVKEGAAGNGDLPKVYLSDSWLKNSHLFISELDSEQFKEINDFFGLCRDLNDMVDRDNNFLWMGTEQMSKVYNR